MGEIAEMALECEKVPRNPRYKSFDQIKARKPHQCPDCGKRFAKEIAVADHRRALHRAAP